MAVHRRRLTGSSTQTGMLPGAGAKRASTRAPAIMSSTDRPDRCNRTRNRGDRINWSDRKHGTGWNIGIERNDRTHGRDWSCWWAYRTNGTDRTYGRDGGNGSVRANRCDRIDGQYWIDREYR